MRVAMFALSLLALPVLAAQQDEASGWDNAKESSEQALQDIWDASKETSSNLWESGKENSSELWEKGKESSQSAWDKSKQHGSDVWQNVEDGGAKAWEKGKQQVETLLEDDQIKDPIPEIKGDEI